MSVQDFFINRAKKIKQNIENSRPVQFFKSGINKPGQGAPEYTKKAFFTGVKTAAKLAAFANPITRIFATPSFAYAAARSAASGGERSPIPTDKEFTYGGLIKAAPVPALIGIGVGEGIAKAQDLYDFVKPYADEGADFVIDKTREYFPTAYQEAKDIILNIPDYAAAATDRVKDFASSLQFPTIPLNVTGIPQPSDFGSTITDEIRAVATALGITIAAAAALLGYSILRKKYKAKKRGKKHGIRKSGARR